MKNGYEKMQAFLIRAQYQIDEVRSALPLGLPRIF